MQFFQLTLMKGDEAVELLKENPYLLLLNLIGSTNFEICDLFKRQVRLSPDCWIFSNEIRNSFAFQKGLNVIEMASF